MPRCTLEAPTPHPMLSTPQHPSATPTTPPRNALIAKKDRLAAEYIRRAAAEIGFAECTLAHTGMDALRLLRQRPVDLGIFGLSFGDIDGIELVSSVIHERLASRVVIATSRKDEYTRIQVRAMTIDAYVDTESEGAETLRAILLHVCGGSRHEFQHIRGRIHPRPGLEKVLTPQEMKVMLVLADGCDDATAGKALCLSQNTVHNHRSRLMRKLGVQTRTELMTVALMKGFIRITHDRVIRTHSISAIRSR